MPYTPGNPEVQVRVFGMDFAGAIARVDARDALEHRAIAAAWLAGAEHDRAARFVVDHARADFLAGRVAAKSAVRAVRPQAPIPSGWEIRRGEIEQPLLEHVLPGMGVSIAHAGGVGLGFAHPLALRCGVDLEHLSREATDAIASQVTPDEIAWARAGGDEEAVRWMLLWTAREALGKSLGIGLYHPDRLLATEQWTVAAPGWRACFAGDDAMIARSIVAGGFVVTLVLPSSVDAEAIATWLSSALVNVSTVDP
jgi:phosphopantetheinyl transferase